MTDDTVQLFVDTNAFIQLRDLKDLPWRELFSKAKGIDIFVGPTVIDELDHLKTGTNERRRNRARLALRMINEASKQTDFSLVLAHTSLNLRLVIAMGPLPDWSTLPRLDPNRADDRLVAEAMCFEGGAAIFSHDTGPRIRARVMGIRAFEPPENWLLPDERTDDQRKIAQLERDLANAQSGFPRIAASLGSLESPRETFDFIVPILPPLRPEIHARLVSAYLDRHPRQRLGAPWSTRENDLMAHMIGRNLQSSYDGRRDQFETAVETYFSQLHDTLRQLRRAASIPYATKNESGVAAQGLRIEVRIDGRATLFAEEEDAASFLGPISLPEPPVFDPEQNPFDHLRTLNKISQPRDPTGFYWFRRPEYDLNDSALQCEDYRATRVWESEIWVCALGNLPTTCTVHLEVSATNLPTPIAKTAIVSMEERELDWSDAIVKELLPEKIRPLFDAAL